MKYLLPFFILLCLSEPVLSQERLPSLGKRKNLAGIGHNYINTYEGIWSARYGRNINNKLTIGLDLGFEYYDNHKSHERTNYFAGPYIRYTFLDRKFSPVLELNYELWTLENRESGKQEIHNGDLMLEGGFRYGGILKDRLSIEYLIGIGRTWEFERNWNGYDFSSTLRINFHFPR